MYIPQSHRGSFCVGLSKNPRSEFSIYARGYFEAAELLASTTMNAPSFPDYAAYPIVFLYRHAIELDLKACIYNSALLSHISSKPELDHSLINEHNLCNLAKRAKRITDTLFQSDESLKEFMKQVVSATEYIHTIDPQSFAFRYPIQRGGAPSFSVQQPFGLMETRDKIRFLHHGLQAIHFGIDVTECIWLEIYDSLNDNECELTIAGNAPESPR